MRNLKKILALVLALVMALSLMTVAGAKSLGEYTDAANVSADYAVAVDFATQIGVLQGMTDTTYAPQGTLTRAQLATMIYRITTGDVTGKYVANFAAGAATQFSDVPAAHWAAGYIAYCADAGYLKGVGDNKYDPNGTLTGYQALAALLRAIGYNQPDQFVGPDWTAQVAEIAYGKGIVAGVYANLNAAITREQAAQLIYNAMWTSKVYYTPMLSYYPLYTNLAHDVFGLQVKEDKLTAKTYTGYDMWMRPSTQWKNSNNKVVVEIADTAVFKANVATTQCDLASALGETGNYTVYVSTNGAPYAAAATYQAKVTNAGIGAQGTQVEVYALGNHEYLAVVIETWLAKVTDVVKATYDAAGHLKTPANTTLAVYDPTVGTATWYAATEAYAKNSYVLVNYCEKVGDDFGVHFVSAAAPVATAAKLTAYTVATTTVGNAYANAAKFQLGKPVYTDIGSYYNVYIDQFGNLIGLVDYEAETAYNFGVVTDIAWQPAVGLAKEYIAAHLLGVNNTPVSNVVIANAWTNAGYGSGAVDFTANTASVSHDIDKNGAFYDHLAKYYVNDKGQYVVEAWGTALSNVTTNPALSYIVANGTTHYTVNANTVYLVKTLVNGVATYTTYTGYANVPAISGAKKGSLFADKNNAYAAYVFIDATAASFPGSTNTVLVLDGAADTIAANYEYNAWIGATQTKLTVVGQTALPGYSDAGLYEVTYNAAGQVVDMDLITWTGDGYTSMAVAYCDGVVIRNSTDVAAVSYGCTDMAVYLVNQAAGTVTAGTSADTVGKTALLVLNVYGTDVVAAYVVVG